MADELGGGGDALLNAFLAEASAADADIAGLDTLDTEEDDAQATENEAADDDDEIEASAEDDNDDDADDEGDEDPDSGADDDDDGDYVEIEIEDGKTERVALSELLEARKELAELGADRVQIRQQIADQASQAVQERIQRYDQAFQQTAEVFELVSQLLPDLGPPDNSLLDPDSPNYDPDTYRERINTLGQVQQVMQQAQSKMQQANYMRQQQLQEQQRIEAEKHWTMLVNADPTWKTGDAAARLDGLRKSVAEAYGFSPQEVAGIFHNGFIRLAEDALVGRKARATPVKAQGKKPPRLVKGGSKQKAANPDQSKREKSARATLRKTGKVTDLEATYGKFLA